MQVTLLLPEIERTHGTAAWQNTLPALSPLTRINLDSQGTFPEGGM